MAFDVEGAKKAGYSDAEIADHLATTEKFDAAGARKAGYSDQEIISHLTAAPAPPAPPVDIATGDQGGMGGSAMPSDSHVVRSLVMAGQDLPPPSAQPAPGAFRRIGAAAYEGGASAPDASGWHPGGVPLGQYVVNPLLTAAGAVFRGGQQFLSEATEPIGRDLPLIGHPGLGRDVAALPEAFPTGDTGAPVGPSTAAAARTKLGRPITAEEIIAAIRKADEPPPANSLMAIADRHTAMLDAAQQQREAPVDPRGVPIRDFTPSPFTMENVERPLAQPEPSVGSGQTGASTAGGPQPTASADGWRPVQPDEVFQPGQRFRMNQTTGVSEVYEPQRSAAASTSAPAGAQITPAAQATLTPEQAAAAGSTADKQWYYKTIVPGEANRIQYIKGIDPTMAQQELTVNAARDSKNLRRISEEADQNERALLGQHSEIRKAEFQDIAGSDVTHETAMKTANDQIERDLQAAYAHGGTVDLHPVLDAANKELTGSAGKLPPMKAAMKEIADAAQKSDGSGLETSPIQANAVRRAIIYMQSKEGRKANPGYGDRDVLAALTRVKDVLTKQVEPAAPGFTKANADYAAARQALDAREALQAYEPKLYTGPLGNMTFGPMHRLMGEVIAGRDPRAPLNPYKALTEEQMARLKSLHDDLQRVASAEELSKAAGGGSDTSQTLFDMAKKAARTGLSTLGGAGTGFVVGHLFGHEAGMASGMFTKTALDSMFSQRAVAQATAEHNRLLRPDLAQYPLKPNPFMQPPTAP